MNDSKSCIFAWQFRPKWARARKREVNIFHVFHVGIRNSAEQHIDRPTQRHCVGWIGVNNAFFSPEIHVIHTQKTRWYFARVLVPSIMWASTTHTLLACMYVHCKRNEIVNFSRSLFLLFANYNTQQRAILFAPLYTVVRIYYSIAVQCTIVCISCDVLCLCVRCRRLWRRKRDRRQRNRYIHIHRRMAQNTDNGDD